MPGCTAALRLIVQPYSPLWLVVPTFTARCLHTYNNTRDPSSERWNYVGVIVPEFCLNDDFHAIWGSFTCRKSTTWDRRLYFSSEGRRAEDFFRPEKSWRLRPGFNPRTWVLKGSTLTLDHRSRLATGHLYDRAKPRVIGGQDLPYAYWLNTQKSTSPNGSSYALKRTFPRAYM